MRLVQGAAQLEGPPPVRNARDGDAGLLRDSTQRILCRGLPVYDNLPWFLIFVFFLQCVTQVAVVGIGVVELLAVGRDRLAHVSNDGVLVEPVLLSVIEEAL